MMLRENSAATGERFAAHVAECEACRVEPPPLESIAAVLNRSVVELDVGGLSARTLRRLRPELAGRGATALWRRVTLGVALALVPLPAVVAYDAYLLQLFYGLVSAVLPAAFAAYLVMTYGAFLVLLFGTTYAAIPLLLARRPVSRHALQG